MSGQDRDLSLTPRLLIQLRCSKGIRRWRRGDDTGENVWKLEIRGKNGTHLTRQKLESFLAEERVEERGLSSGAHGGLAVYMQGVRSITQHSRTMPHCQMFGGLSRHEDRPEQSNRIEKLGETNCTQNRTQWFLKTVINCLKVKRTDWTHKAGTWSYKRKYLKNKN